MLVFFGQLSSVTEAMHSVIVAMRSRMLNYLDRHRLLRFIWQTIKSIFFITVIFTLFAWVPEHSAEIGWLFIYALPGVLAAVIWLLVRLWRRHGMSSVLSVFAAVAVLTTVQYGFMRRDVARASPVNIEVPLRADEEVSILDLSDFMNSCGMGCLEVLANTNYRVLLRDRLYRAIRDDTCRAGPNRSSYFAYLRAGYATTCIGETKVSQPSRVLMLNDLYCNYPDDDGPDCDQLPTSFVGRIVTTRLVTPHSSRIVSRWIEGGIRPYNGWFAFVGLESLPVGEWRNMAELLTRVLGTEIQISNVTGNDNLDVVLTELEAFLDDPEYSEQAWRAFWSLSHVRGRDNQQVLRRHIRALLARVERAHVLAGLNLVTHGSNIDVRDQRARIVELSADPDPVVSDFAHRALRHIDHTRF